MGDLGWLEWGWKEGVSGRVLGFFLGGWLLGSYGRKVGIRVFDKCGSLYLLVLVLVVVVVI